MNKTFTRIYGLLFCYLAFQSIVFAQYQTKSLNWNTKAYESYTYKGPEGTMPYRLLKPRGYNPAIKYPMVIMLHGRGEGIGSCGSPDCALVWGGKMHLDSIAKRPSFIVFPRTYGGDWSTLPLNKVIGIMKLLIQTYNIDLDRIYIHGLSAGGSGTWNMGINHPNFFAAISPHSAAGNPAAAKNLVNTPIWTVQGEKDGSPKPSASIQMMNQLQALGKKPIYTLNPTTRQQSWPKANTTEPIYTLAPNTGHEAWPVLYNSHGWLAWMYTQKLTHIIATGGTQVGSGKTVKLGVPQGFLAYEWSNGAKTNQITVTTPGTYKVRYKRYAYLNAGPQIWSNWSDPIVITGNAAIATALINNKTSENLFALAGIKSESVATFTLINAESGQELYTIKDGDTINYAKLPTKKLDLRFNSSDATIQSVEFNYDGKIRNETKLPFSVFGDVNGKYNGYVMEIEQHILIARPFSDSQGVLVEGEKTVITFTVMEEADPPQKLSKAAAFLANPFTSFTLVNADNEKDLFNIRKGDTINLSKLPTQNLNIRVNPSDPLIQSYELNFDGKIIRETVAPYSVFGDVNGDYYGKTMGAQQHVLIATAFNSSQVQIGSAEVLEFTVINQTTYIENYIIGYTLINADNDTDLFKIKNGDVINLSSLPTQNLNIRANTSGGTFEIVEFNFDGKITTESQAPYSLFGDVKGNFNGKKINVGHHILITTPYSSQSGEGKSYTVEFTVVAQSPSASILAKEMAVPVKVNLYPNPIEDRIFISFTEEQVDVKVYIFDKFGNLLHEINTISLDGKNSEADISNLVLKPGIYIIKVNSDKIKEQTFQVLKNY